MMQLKKKNHPVTSFSFRLKAWHAYNWQKIRRFYKAKKKRQIKLYIILKKK
jgi:hypothetical protein